MSTVGILEIDSPAYISSDVAEHQQLRDPSTSKIVSTIFQAASYLTDPVCKAHENFRRFSTVDSLHSTRSGVANLIRKISICTQMIGWGSLAVATTIPGILLRSLGLYLQKDSFVVIHGNTTPKILPADRSFSLLSWNICCVAGGYSISDGGVIPWSFRIDAIIKKILEKNADVNCLYETFDSKSAFYICKQLQKNGYNHFYFNIGPQAIGVSSGILVASKYHIQNPEFSQFPLDSLVGRTKAAAKGVFSFDLVSGGKNFARIYSTHLQHSEQPEFPTAEEVAARKKQMQIIVDKVKTAQKKCIVVTGDLNLDDAEYKSSSWQSYFQKGDQFGNDQKTWGGDEFCARFVGKQISGPLNLDHTMVLNETAHSIETTHVDVGYDPTVFKEDALSDHSGLFSKISIR